jgi:hypothetical protein
VCAAAFKVGTLGSCALCVALHTARQLDSFVSVFVAGRSFRPRPAGNAVQFCCYDCDLTALVTPRAHTLQTVRHLHYTCHFDFTKSVFVLRPLGSKYLLPTGACIVAFCIDGHPRVCLCVLLPLDGVTATTRLCDETRLHFVVCSMTAWQLNSLTA